MEKKYLILSTLFSVVVILSNLLSVHLIQAGSVALPCGLLLYPITFILSDLVTEKWGKRAAQMMLYTGFGMSILSHLIFSIALMLPSLNSETHNALEKVFSLNGWAVLSSLVAYFVGQMVDVSLYAKIREWTGDKYLWLRNNGSTLVSQLFDTIIVNTILFGFVVGLPKQQLITLIIVSYSYKAVISLGLTPFYYILVKRVV